MYATPEDAPLLGLLSEFGELVDGEIKPTIMEGSISGPVLILKSTPDNPEQPVEERPGFVSVRFKISADPQFPLASSCFVE